MLQVPASQEQLPSIITPSVRQRSQLPRPGGLADAAQIFDDHEDEDEDDVASETAALLEEDLRGR